MYKSIVFDLGGVMVDFAPRAYLVDRICNEEIEEQVYDLTFGSEEWKQLDAGLVSRFDGNQAMLRNAKAAGREFEVQGVLDDWLQMPLILAGLCSAMLTTMVRGISTTPLWSGGKIIPNALFCSASTQIPLLTRWA